MKKEIIIDGNNFSNLAEFYEAVEKKMTKNLDWKIGRNLNAFNDVLRGGFVVFEYEEPIKLVWKNFEKSKTDFSWKETLTYLEDSLTICHPSNTSYIKTQIKKAKEKTGQTILDIIIEIIEGHEHIEFIKQ